MPKGREFLYGVRVQDDAFTTAMAQGLVRKSTTVTDTPSVKKFPIPKGHRDRSPRPGRRNGV